MKIEQQINLALITLVLTGICLLGMGLINNFTGVNVSVGDCYKNKNDSNLIVMEVGDLSVSMTHLYYNRLQVMSKEELKYMYKIDCKFVKELN